MDSSEKSRLTPFQREVLGAFFELETGFFLTGGGALAGFHLGHRETMDLDLFTSSEEAFARGERVLREVATRLDATLEARVRSPGFARFVLERVGDGVVVDVVLDRAPQVFGQKEVHDGVRVDPAREILANKLTTLLGRTEERDLVDLYFLERGGLRIEDAVPDAMEKDGGFTPATLAWVLSEIRLPADRDLPAGIPSEDLQTYLDDLVRRLRRLASPGAT